MRHPLFSLLLPLAPLASAWALAGCGADFEAASRLSKLRVLALQAEPANPAEGQSTTLTPLVYSPSDSPLSLSWSWCPLLGQADDGYTCPITYEQASALVAGAGLATPLPSFDLGTAPTASLTNVFPAALLASLCTSGFDETKLDCRHGFPLRVLVRITQGAAEQRATTVVRLPLTDGENPNANPVVGGLTAEVASAPVPLDDAGTVVLPRAKDSVLHVTVDESASETYVGPDADGVVGDRRETLLFSWFAELGEIDAGRTLFIDGTNTLADSSKDKWKPPATREDTRGRSKIFVVARDDRGGVSWTSATASLEATP